MKLETFAKRDENKNEFINHYYSDTFSISELHFCFTRGINIIK
jgi:hypothetical protein